MSYKKQNKREDLDEEFSNFLKETKEKFENWHLEKKKDSNGESIRKKDSNGESIRKKDSNFTNGALGNENQQNEDLTTDKAIPPIMHASEQKGFAFGYNAEDSAFNHFIAKVKSSLPVLSESSYNIKTPKKTENLHSNVSKSENEDPNKKNVQPMSKGSLKLQQIENKASKNFLKGRIDISQELFQFFNEAIFNSKLPKELPVIWKNSLRTTAGLTHLSNKEGYSCRIELSSHVLTTFGRLRDTLLHEMCHAACWIVNQNNNHHGPLWHIWANRCRIIFPELEVPTRCHTYEIKHKLTYKCASCDWKIGRERKIKDLDSKRCPKCRQPIILIK